MSRGSEALTTVLASIAIGMIAKDPELIGRLRKEAAEEGVPFEADDISRTMLEMTSMDLLEAGQRLVSDPPGEHQRGLRAGAVIPIPRIDGAAQESASALSVASYAIEFVHSVPGRLDAFHSWMRKEHPDVTPGQDIPREQVEQADRLVTLMSKVAGKIADDRGEGLGS
jgi:hypothetical protein